MNKEPRLRYKDLSLVQLHSFCEVCRLGGFASAARRLNLTSPAVWEQVRALENLYGVKLLRRTGNRVHPTPEGEHLLGLVRPLLAGLNSTREALQQHGGQAPERLTVVSSVRVLMPEIIQALGRFQERRSGIVLRIQQVESNAVGPLVLEEEADLGLMFKPGPDDPVPEGLAYEPVHKLDFLLVAPPHHPLMRRRRFQLQDIVAQALVLGRPEAFSRRRLEQVLHTHNLDKPVRKAVETNSGNLTLHAVRAGLGVGIVVADPKGALLQGLATRSLRRWFGTAEIVFVRRDGSQIPSIHRELAESIRSGLTH